MNSGSVMHLAIFVQTKPILRKFDSPFSLFGIAFNFFYFAFFELNHFLNRIYSQMHPKIILKLAQNLWLHTEGSKLLFSSGTRRPSSLLLLSIISRNRCQSISSRPWFICRSQGLWLRYLGRGFTIRPVLSRSTSLLFHMHLSLRDSTRGHHLIG